MKYRALFVLLLSIALMRSVALIVDQAHYFFSRGFAQNYENFRFAYENSQYVKKEKPGIITDETLESFAAGAFLRGLNPILIVHDQPPLGRYISVLSILLFDNSHTITIPLVILSGLGLFLIAKIILKNMLVALIPCAIFFNEPRFLNMFNYTPVLETIQLPFIVFALYFFMRALLEKVQYSNWFILTSLMLGFVISIRFFALGAVLLLAMLVSLFVDSRWITRKTVIFVATLPLSLVVLVLSYIRTMQDGYSLWQIFGIQKYILFYHQSKFILPFSFWDLLLFNKWHTWWGERSISSDPQWILAWPIATIAAALSGILAILKKIKLGRAESVLILWCVFYALSLSTGYTSTRYFLPLIPFLYILATALVVRCVKGSGT